MSAWAASPGSTTAGPILDALRQGRFFVTTGEVLLRDFNVGGRASGETLRLGDRADPPVSIELEWTFPLRFAEIVSGDGEHVYRDRIDLSHTPPFGRERLANRVDLRGRRWVRVEAWDVAGDGAFSQPVWLESPEGGSIIGGRDDLAAGAGGEGLPDGGATESLTKATWPSAKRTLTPPGWRLRAAFQPGLW